MKKNVKKVEIVRKGRPINPESKRQQRISLMEISKRGKGRPKGTFKAKILAAKVDVDVDELIKRLDTKIAEIKQIQTEISVVLKYYQILGREIGV